MRAPSRRNQQQGGAWWLRPELENTTEEGNVDGKNTSFGRRLFLGKERTQRFDDFFFFLITNY